MSAVGANLIVLRPCPSCGTWPYSHTPDCPVALMKAQSHRELDDLMAAAVSAQPAAAEETR